MAENTNPLDSYAAKYRKPATGDTESVNPLDAFAAKYRKAAQPTPATDGNILSDTATDLKAGVLKTPGMLAGLADIPAGLVGLDRPVDKLTDKIGEATGFTPGKWAEESQKTGYSPERQQSDQNVQNAWDAYDKGEQTLTGAIGETLSNPRTLLGNTVESLPSMFAGGIGGKALLGAKALAPAIGEGAVMAGQQMENIDDTVDPQKAAALSLGTGAIGAGLGLAGGKVAQKAGWVDPESAIGGIAQQAAPGKPLSTPARIAGGAASEGLLEELPQSIVEQGAQNIAEDKPLTQDMARSGVQGALAGGLMGGAFNTIKVSPITGEEIPPETETSGPLGAALNAGAVEVQAALPPPAKQLPAPDPALEFNRSHVPPDANIVFDDGSQTSAYDYFNQRMAEHGNEQKAREETYVALNGKPSPVIGIPELVFLSDGTSLSKADVLRGFMAQGYDEQAANDYLRKIVETPVEERTTVNLDPYRFLQERDANTKAPETAKPDDQNPVTPAETQAAQSEVTPTGDIPTPESTISPQPTEVNTDEKQSTDQSTGQQGQGQEGLLKPFKPTHLLNDGTPVIEGEDSFGKYWQSEDGNQFDSAEPATPVTEDSNEQSQNTAPQEVSAEETVAKNWDRQNRNSRSTEWMAGAAESNPAFNSADGDTIPAHGMAKAATLGQALSDLKNILTNGFDSNRTLYYDSLTNNKNKLSGGSTGTSGGHAYRDGAFIITFREGLSGQPTKDDITGVLVNPAHPELVPILQKQFPGLTIRDYKNVSDVVTASKNTSKAAPTEETVDNDLKGLSQDAVDAYNHLKNAAIELKDINPDQSSAFERTAASIKQSGVVSKYFNKDGITRMVESIKRKHEIKTSGQTSKQVEPVVWTRESVFAEVNRGRKRTFKELSTDTRIDTAIDLANKIYAKYASIGIDPDKDINVAAHPLSQGKRQLQHLNAALMGMHSFRDGDRASSVIDDVIERTRNFLDDWNNGDPSKPPLSNSIDGYERNTGESGEGQSPTLDETLDTTGDKTGGSESPTLTTNVPRFVENQSPRWRQTFGVDDAVSFASTPDSFTKDTLGGKPIGHFLSQMHLWEDGYKDLDGRLLKGGAAGHNASAKDLIENWRLYAKAKLTFDSWRAAHPEEAENLDKQTEEVRSLKVGDKVLIPDFVRTEQDSHKPEYKEATIVKKNPKNWVVKSSNGVDMHFRPEALRPVESKPSQEQDDPGTKESIQKQLADAKAELDSQGMITNADTSKRVRDLEYQLAEITYPGIAKHVANQGDIAMAVGSAIDVNTPNNWRGDYPREAQIQNAIYRAIRNYNWTEENARKATVKIFREYVLKGDEPAKNGEEKPSTVDNKSTETQETDKPDKKTRLKPFNQEALKGNEDALTGMAKTAGWYEVGGQLLRDDQGNVTGRTKWLPKSDWYAEVPTDSRLNESDTVEAVRKAIAGEPMTAKEHRAVQFMLDYMEVMEAGGEQAKAEADLNSQAIIDEANDLLDDTIDDGIDLLFESSNVELISGETIDEQIERIFGPALQETDGSPEQTDAQGKTQADQRSDDQAGAPETEREKTREDYLNDPEFVKFLKSNKTDIDFGSGPVKMTYERGLYKLDKMIGQFKGFIACMG